MANISNTKDMPTLIATGLREKNNTDSNFTIRHNPDYKQKNRLNPDPDLQQMPDETVLSPLAQPSQVSACDPADYSTEPSVKVKHKFLSHRPKIVYAEAQSKLEGFQSTVKIVVGGENYAAFARHLPTLFKEEDRPHVNMQVMRPFSAVVAITGIHTVSKACKGYTATYTESVASLLNQQKKLIDALREDGATPEILQPLEDIHRQGEDRAAKRKKLHNSSLPAVVVRNASSKLHREKGNGDLSGAFIAKAEEVIEHTMSMKKLEASEASNYQLKNLQASEADRHKTKQDRTTHLLNVVQLGSSAVGALPDAVSQGVDIVSKFAKVTGNSAPSISDSAFVGTLGTVSTAAGLAGQIPAAINTFKLWGDATKDRTNLKKENQAVENIAYALPPSVNSLYEQDAHFHLKANTQQMVHLTFSTLSQAVMAASAITGLTPAAAASLPLLGVGMLTSSVGSRIKKRNDERIALHTGKNASSDLKKELALPDLGTEIRKDGLDNVIMQTANRYESAQQSLIECVLWRDMLSALRKEDILKNAPISGGERYARVARRNATSLNHSHLTPDGVTAMIQTRQARYTPDFFEGSVEDVYLQVKDEVREHPHCEKIEKSDVFRVHLLMDTCTELAELNHPETEALFFDAEGKRVKNITISEVDTFLKHSPVARAIYMKSYCDVMVQHLVQGQSYSRESHYKALGSLAQTKEIMVTKNGDTFTIRL